MCLVLAIPLLIINKSSRLSVSLSIIFLWDKSCRDQDLSLSFNSKLLIIAAITVYFRTLKNVQLSDKQIFTVFLKQSSAEMLNAFLKKVLLNLYLEVISQFLAGSMKRIEKPFLLRCL